MKTTNLNILKGTSDDCCRCAQRRAERSFFARFAIVRSSFKFNFKFLRLLILGMAFSKIAYGADQPENHLYFMDSYHTRFTSVEQAEKAIKENGADAGKNFETLLEYANFYYIIGARLPLKSKLSIEYSEKALDVYQKLWKKKFSDPRMQFLVANALVFQGTNPNINIGTLVEYVFKARNLYSMIVDRYADNLDGRLGRARINMGLNSATGRPDEVHREDIRLYIEGYPKLPADIQKNPFYKNGLHEMYLARAMLAVETKQWSEAEKNIKIIDTACLHEQARKYYDGVLKELEKQTSDKGGKK